MWSVLREYVSPYKNRSHKELERQIRGEQVRIIIFVTTLFLAGCEQPPNELVIAEKHKCVSAGMDYSISDFGKVKCLRPMDKSK